MSLTPEVKADLEHLAAHSSSEEERTQAQEALRELEERAAEQASPGQLYLRARRGLPVRSSTADNIKNGNGTAFETVQKNLEDVLNATRGDRLARIDEGTVGKGKFPEKSIDDLPPPAKPQCTGNAGDFPIFKGALDTYLAHYQLLSFTIADSDPTKNSRAATALRIIKESVATTQPFGKHVKLAPAVDRTQLERVVHAAHNAKSAYDAVLTFFRHNVTAARKQNLTTRFHRCKQGTNSVAIYLRELQGHVLEMRRCGIDISDEAAIIQLIQNAQPDLKTRAKLSRRLIGDDLAEVIRDLLDDADISDTDEDPRKRSMLDAPPRRNPRRPGNRTYLTSAERLYRAYRVDMRGVCHGCLSPDHRQFDERDGKWVCPNTQQRQDEGKFPAPGKSLPHKQRAFRVERTPPPPEVPPNDDEEEEQRLDGTDNAGHASDGGHATTDGEDDWEALQQERKSFRISTQAAAYMATQPPRKTQEELITHRVLWDSCSDCNATGDKSIFVGKLQSSGATLEGVNPTPVEPLVGSVEFQLHTPEGRTGTIRTKMFYVEGLPVTILSEHGTREEHAHTFEGPSDAQPTVTVLDRMATVMADFNRPEQPSWSIRFKTCMMKLDEMHVTEINNITSRQETPWHGTMMPAPGADRRGRSYRNSRTYSGKTHKPRSQKFADTMHAAPRKYVGRRFRSIFSEDDGAVTHGEGIIIDYDANTGWWRGRYDDDVEGLNVQEEDFNARELLRWTAEYDAAHDTHELDRGWFNIPGHEEYATTLEWYRQLEADVAHEFTHEACGRNDGQNVRAKSHGSPRNPFENWKPRSPQTLPDDADYENVLLNPEYSQAQKFLDLARQKHANHTGVGFTAVVPDWDHLDVTGWTTMRTIAAGTHLFQHPNGAPAGALKWPVLILRLDPMLGDATVGVEPHHDMEYGLPGDRAACKSHVHLTVREQTNLITHCKHGHKGPAVLEEMLRQGLISKKEYYPNAAIPYCEACATGGMRKRDDRIRHHEHVSPQPAPGEVLVVDHIPLSTPGIDGITGLLITVDKCTRYIIARLLKSPDDMETAFQEAVAFWHARRRTVRVIKSDRGSNLISAKLKTWFGANKIDTQPTAADDHHQVGTAEKAVDLIKTLASVWMQQHKLDAKFYAYALAHAAQVINRTPMKTIDWRVPFKLATGAMPDLTCSGVFGTRCFSHVSSSSRPHKLAPRATEGVYLGFDPERHGATEPGHILLRTETGQIVSSRSVSFDHTTIIVASRRSRTYAIKDMPGYGSSSAPLKDPRNRAEMLRGPHAADFVRGEMEEITSLWELGCWSRRQLADLPPNAEILPTTWSYRYKLDPVTGEVKRFKSRFCVRGDREREVHVRFSAQIALNILRMCIALHGAGVFPYMSCFDVGNAYANTPQTRVVYIRQPPGYDDGTGDVFELHRALYGQSDAGRQFWLHLESVLRDAGYAQSAADPCLFFKGNFPAGTLICLATYVDDISVFAQRSADVEEAYTSLHAAFDKLTRQDGDELTQIIGMQLSRSSSGVRVHQTAYAQRILDTFPDVTGSFATPTRSEPPPTPSPLLSDVQTGQFRKAVGMLLYLVNLSRPDLAYATRAAAQGMARPTAADWQQVERILGYLRTTVNYGLFYPAMPGIPNMRAYVDADFAGEVDRKSISGMLGAFGQQGAFMWKSTKQHLTAKSSTEAELIALADNCSSIIVARRALGELGIIVPGPTVIYEDNTAAITILRDIVYSGRTKHIDVRLQYVRDQVRRLVLELRYIDTKDQLADLLTKGLSRDDFCKLRDRTLCRELAPRDPAREE